MGGRSPARLLGVAHPEQRDACLRELVVDVHGSGAIGGDVETAFLQICAMCHGIASLAIDGLLHGFHEIVRSPDDTARDGIVNSLFGDGAAACVVRADDGNSRGLSSRERPLH